MAAKTKLVRRIADMLGRVAGDYTSPAALYRAIREVHPKAAKKQIALAALAVLVVGSSGGAVKVKSVKKPRRETERAPR